MKLQTHTADNNNKIGLTANIRCQWQIVRDNNFNNCYEQAALDDLYHDTEFFPRNLSILLNWLWKGHNFQGTCKIYLWSENINTKIDHIM